MPSSVRPRSNQDEVICCSPSPEEWKCRYQYIQFLHEKYGHQYGAVKIIPPSASHQAPQNLLFTQKVLFEAKVQPVTLLDGEIRQEIAFERRVRIHKYATGIPFEKGPYPTIRTAENQMLCFKIRKCQLLLSAELFADLRNQGKRMNATMQREFLKALNSCMLSFDGSAVPCIDEKGLVQARTLVSEWYIEESLNKCESTSASARLYRKPPDHLSTAQYCRSGEFWLYDRNTKKSYITRISGGWGLHGNDREPVRVRAVRKDPETQAESVLYIDEEDVDEYLANGSSEVEARSGLCCKLCAVCLKSCGEFSDLEPSVHFEKFITQDELEQIDKSRPSLICSGCGYAVHLSCLVGTTVNDESPSHYTRMLGNIAKYHWDWFCSDCEENGDKPFRENFGFGNHDGLVHLERFNRICKQSLEIHPFNALTNASVIKAEALFWNYVCRDSLHIYANAISHERNTNAHSIYYASDVDLERIVGPAAMPNAYDEKYDSSSSLREMALSSLSVLKHLPETAGISGMSRPWVYVGSPGSSFCWHYEDHFLFSVNYLHQGKPKVWYTVPGSAREKVSMAFQDMFPDLMTCGDVDTGERGSQNTKKRKISGQDINHGLVHRLVTHVDPRILSEKYGIPVTRVVQYPGEFVVTFPEAYHCGFNMGFNVAEAVNLACASWIPHGIRAISHYRQTNRQPLFSMEKLLWKIIESGAHNMWRSSSLYKSALLQYLTSMADKLKEYKKDRHIFTKSDYEESHCERCNQYCYFAKLQTRDLCADCAIETSNGKIKLLYTRYSAKEMQDKINTFHPQGSLRTVNHMQESIHPVTPTTGGCEDVFTPPCRIRTVKNKRTLINNKS